VTVAVAVLGAGWLLSVLVPLGWWWRRGRRLDVWSALPVPAALLDRHGRVLATTGAGGPPLSAADLTGPVPPPGAVLRAVDGQGRLVSLRGVRGGALAVACPDGPASLQGARDRLAGDLALRLAHDLSSPLMAVRGHLDLVAHEPLRPVAARSVEVAVAELERAVTLTRDVVSLTSLRAGTAGLSVELAGALAEEAVTALLDAADAAGARLSVSTPAEPVRVAVMSGALIRALRNLVANALSHGLGQRREIEVAVSLWPPGELGRGSAAAGVVRFLVRDGGPGLTEEQLGDLVRPHVRGAGSRGSGLGLAIVAEVLAAHGSRLRAEPAADGRGQVWFDLPVLARGSEPEPGR
jgi:signal transduction histidine kinase